MPLSYLIIRREAGLLMDERMVPKEVIVVEGRSDTQRLIETFGPQVKTIETNGSAIDQEIINRIQKAQAKFGVIVFTDPDYPGQRIRQIIKSAVPQVKEAFLSQKQANSHKAKDSLGIEHATSQAIRQALEQVMTPVQGLNEEKISMSDLFQLGLVGQEDSEHKRQNVAQYFNLGHVNAKQLQKQLINYGIPLDQVASYLAQGDEYNGE